MNPDLDAAIAAAFADLGVDGDVPASDLQVQVVRYRDTFRRVLAELRRAAPLSNDDASLIALADQRAAQLIRDF